MKIEDLRIGIETDREVVKGYRRDDGTGHVEVFKVTNPAGEYATMLLWDADSEAWTIEPDEIWAASFRQLMPALEWFTRHESEIEEVSL